MDLLIALAMFVLVVITFVIGKILEKRSIDRIQFVHKAIQHYYEKNLVSRDKEIEEKNKKAAKNKFEIISSSKIIIEELIVNINELMRLEHKSDKTQQDIDDYAYYQSIIIDCCDRLYSRIYKLIYVYDINDGTLVKWEIILDVIRYIDHDKVSISLLKHRRIIYDNTAALVELAVTIDSI